MWFQKYHNYLNIIEHLAIFGKDSTFRFLLYFLTINAHCLNVLVIFKVSNDLILFRILVIQSYSNLYDSK